MMPTTSEPCQPYTSSGACTFDLRRGTSGSVADSSKREAICNLARQQVELIQLTVVRDNEQARRLYARLGFLEYGLEKNALKQGGRYYDEVTYGERLSGRMIACRYRARLPR